MRLTLRRSLQQYGHYLPVILIPLILFIEPIVKGEALFWGLPATQFIPWRSYAWQQVLQGYWPLWNPLNGMGAPLLANYQLAFFYPPGWILSILQSIGGVPWMAWGFMVLNVLHLIWAGLGMMLFLRGLGVSSFGQMVGGLAFGLSGFMVARIGTGSMIWAGSWLPWILLGGLALTKGINRKRFVDMPFGLLAGLTMQLLAGHAQLTFYSIIFLVMWVVFLLVNQSVKDMWKGLSLLLFIGLIALGLAAAQLIPTGEYLLQSQRSDAVDYELGMTYSFWPWRFLSFLSPDFFGNPADGTYFGYASYWEDAVYIGVIPLLLALCSIGYLITRIRKRHNNQEYFGTISFFWIVIIIGALFSLGKNTPIFPFFYKYIPTFDLFNAPSRYMIWVNGSLAVLAGIMADQWFPVQGKARKRLKRITVATAAVTLGALATWVLLRQVQVTFIQATTTAGIFALGYCALSLAHHGKVEHTDRWKWMVIGVISIDLLVNAWGLTPTISREFYSEAHRFNQVQDLQSDERVLIEPGNEYGIKFGRFFRFSDFSAIEPWQNLRQVMLPNMNLLDGISMVNNFDPLVPDRYSKIMNEMQLLDEETKSNMFRWMNIGRIETRDPQSEIGVSFSRTQPKGRFRWVGCAEIVENSQYSFERTIDKMRVADSENVVILEDDRSLPEHVCNQRQEIVINPVLNEPQKVILNTSTIEKGYLVIADTFYPGWEVKLDGVVVDVFRANYLFYAIVLPEGPHQIEIIYQPKSFYTGLSISGISLLFVILLVIIKRRTRNIINS